MKINYVKVVLTFFFVTVTTCHEVLLAPGVQTVVDLRPGARPGADSGLRVITQPLYDASHVTELGHVFSYVAGADMIFFKEWLQISKSMNCFSFH